MPLAAEATGVRQKLVSYSLNLDHEQGGPKARGFEAILGITLDHVDYLEAEIRAGILVAPVHAIRNAIPGGFKCLIEIPIRGLGEKRSRTANVRTVWLLARAGEKPRLTTAFARSGRELPWPP